MCIRDRQIIQVVVDRVKMGPELLTRLTDSIETAYQEGGGDAFAIELGMRSSERDVDAEVTQHRFSEKFECRSCQIQYELPQPRLFSFNSPYGACCEPCKPVCDATNVPPRPIPDIDSRKMIEECDAEHGGAGETEPCPKAAGCYTPEVCGHRLGACGGASTLACPKVCCTGNPCVRMPAIFPLVDCSDTCCEQDCGCW